MNKEGPSLESLTRRIAETPLDFLAEPRIGKSGQIHVAAVVNDLVRELGGALAPDDLSGFAGKDRRADRNRLGMTLIICWMLADEWFRSARPGAQELISLLRDEAALLAGQVAAGKAVSDPDRREELVRLALARLGYRPEGETTAQAQDRLTTLSSIERARVLRASRAAEERARAIREALAKKAAEESADKFTRE